MAKVSLVEFSWPVPTAGYQWWEDPEDGEWWLFPTDSGEAELPVRVTHPFEDEPALFMEFGQLGFGQDPDAFLAFANAHGLIGYQEKEIPDKGLVRGLKLSDWKGFAGWFHLVIHAWDAAKGGDLDEMNRTLFEAFRGVHVVAEGVGKRAGVIASSLESHQVT